MAKINATIVYDNEIADVDVFLMEHHIGYIADYTHETARYIVPMEIKELTEKFINEDEKYKNLNTALAKNFEECIFDFGEMIVKDKNGNETSIKF